MRKLWHYKWIQVRIVMKTSKTKKEGRRKERKEKGENASWRCGDELNKYLVEKGKDDWSKGGKIRLNFDIRLQVKDKCSGLPEHLSLSLATSGENADNLHRLLVQGNLYRLAVGYTLQSSHQQPTII